MKYLHDFNIVFCILSETEDADTLSCDALIAALEDRLNDLRQHPDKEAFEWVTTERC